MRRARTSIWDLWPIAGLALGAAAAIYAVWWAYQNPCVQEERYACTRSVCSFHVYDPSTHTTRCTAWTQIPDTCTRCLKRVSRRELEERQDWAPVKDLQ